MLTIFWAYWKSGTDRLVLHRTATSLQSAIKCSTIKWGKPVAKHQLSEWKFRNTIPSFNWFTYSLNKYRLSTLFSARDTVTSPLMLWTCLLGDLFCVKSRRQVGRCNNSTCIHLKVYVCVLTSRTNNSFLQYFCYPSCHCLSCTYLHVYLDV